jgi:hypothetical protein
MTAKAKAKELFKKYSKGKDEHGWSLCEFDSCAKQCALIAVDEILEVIIFNKYDDKYWEEEEYWQEVKQEIELL